MPSGRSRFTKSIPRTPKHASNVPLCVRMSIPCDRYHAYLVKEPYRETPNESTARCLPSLARTKRRLLVPEPPSRPCGLPRTAGPETTSPKTEEENFPSIHHPLQPFHINAIVTSRKSVVSQGEKPEVPGLLFAGSEREGSRPARQLDAETGLAPVSALGVVSVQKRSCQPAVRVSTPTAPSGARVARRVGSLGEVGVEEGQPSSRRPGEGCVCVCLVLWFSDQPYLMVLPVRRRIHWGMGRFCFCALASFCLVRKVLWLCRGRIPSAVVLREQT